jgi:hypothetical protein
MTERTIPNGMGQATEIFLRETGNTHHTRYRAFCVRKPYNQTRSAHTPRLTHPRGCGQGPLVVIGEKEVTGEERSHLADDGDVAAGRGVTIGGEEENLRVRMRGAVGSPRRRTLGHSAVGSRR